MADDLAPHRDDDIGPWSEHKLDLLARYVPAYMRIMAKQRSTWCRGGVHYVDAFAGTSRPRARDEDRYVKGSPRIALELAQPFDTYTFIEKEPWRAARLRELAAEYPDRVIEVVEGDCNDVILRDVVPKIRHEQQARGFVFLDPFGMQLRWDVIEAIAETRALEVVLNFPTMALNRAGLPTAAGALTSDHTRRMNVVWGSEGWREPLYGRRPTLWGEEVEIKRRPTNAEHLGRLFAQQRLSTVFSHVSEPLVIRNSRNADLYCLIFAGPNENGAKIAGDVFGRRHHLQPPPVALPLPWAEAFGAE